MHIRYAYVGARIAILFFFLSLGTWTNAQYLPTPDYPDSLNKRRLRAALITEGTFFVGGLSFLYANWYADRERVPFNFYNDAAGYNQIDKAGHAFGAYLYSDWGYRSLRRAGVNKKKALIWGAGLGLYFQTPIEVFDGLYEGWGFSWSDMGANALGAGLVLGQEALFEEQLVRMKFSFSRSPYSDRAFGLLGNNYLGNLVNDYNGHTYWLSTSIHRLAPKPIQANIPKWLNIAAGYGAGGMYGEFENRTFYRGNRLPTNQERYRQFYLSLDVDWTQIPTRSRFLRSVFEGLNYIKFPLPGLEYNTKGEFKGKLVAF